MSTKNLSRTVIEGGRRGHNKYERRHSHREERAAQREVLSTIKSEDDWDEAAAIQRRTVRPSFSDKLSPVTKFLDAHVGKYWPKVYSEIRQKFDSRTTAGRHILFDHLLREVKGSGQPEASPSRWSRQDYFVDAQSILRKAPKRRRYRTPWQARFDWNRLCYWLRDRRVVRRSGKLYWSEPVEVRNVHAVWRHDERDIVVRYAEVDKRGELVKHKYTDPTGYVYSESESYPVQTWRRTTRLAREDEKYFASLPATLQERLVL